MLGKYAEAQLREEVTGTGKTDWLDISAFPLSSIQVYSADGEAFTADVEQSNVEADMVGQIVTAITTSTLVTLDKGAKFVRVHVKTGTGKVGARWSGAFQS